MTEERKRLYYIGCLQSLFVAFMFGVFAPLEVYLSNKDSYFFDGREMFGFMTAVFVMLLAIASFFSVILIHFIGNKSLTLFSLFSGILLFFYLQGNFDITEYGTWDGSTIEWERFTVQKYVWIGILIVCISLFAVLAKSVKEEYNYMILSALPMCIILIQIVTLITLFLSVGGIQKESEYVAIEEGECEFSSGENLIVLVLDSYDSSVLTDIMIDDDGYYREILRDFVYYPDSSGYYSYTNLAIPHMITGVKYYNDAKYGEYLENAYMESSVLEMLHSQGWEVGIYTDAMFPNNSYAVNGIVNCKEIKRTVTSHRRLGKYIYQIVLFRYLPQPIKKFFVAEKNSIESEFGGNDKDYILFDSNNKAFEKQYHDAKVIDKGKTFRFIHIYGAHPPYYLNADNTSSETVTSEVDVCKANLEMVDGFLDKLREIEIYDNSTIVICADHGVLQLRQNPLFMIKYKGSSHEFEYANVPFSYDDFPFLYEAIIKGSDENDINNALNLLNDHPRKYLKYSHDTLNYNSYCGEITEYEIDGPAYNETSFKKTGTKY